MVNPMRFGLVSIVAAFMAVGPGEARADLVAVAFDSKGAGVTGGGPNAYGWQFHTRDTIKLSALGLWDGITVVNGEGGGYGDGLSAAHEIAIWEIGGSSLPVVSAFIPAGTTAPLREGFRYVSIPSTRLEAGRDYAIIAEYGTGDDGLARQVDNPNLVFTFDGHIEFGGRRWAPYAGVLQFPENHEPDFVGEFGPNFEFVPEPSPLMLGALAAGAGAVRHRRRQRR